jgi:hypothetical protein
MRAYVLSLTIDLITRLGDISVHDCSWWDELRGLNSYLLGETMLP